MITDIFWCYIKEMMNAFHSCDGTDIFMRWKIKCSIQLGFASLDRTFNLSPHENIRTIAPITIHFLYNIEISHISYLDIGRPFCTLACLYCRQHSFGRQIVEEGCRISAFLSDFLNHTSQNTSSRPSSYPSRRQLLDRSVCFIRL